MPSITTATPVLNIAVVAVLMNNEYLKKAHL